MFEFVHNRRIIFGENKIDELPSILRWHHCKRVLFVTRHAAQATEDIVKALKKAGIDTFIYDSVKGEPDLHMINNARDLFLQKGCDCTVAMGGGSIIDVAKAANMLAVNGGNVEEYQMDDRQVTKIPPLFIAIPTTAGTGAEATKTSVVINNYNGLKKSLYHNTMIADIVILDPVLTTSLPARITASTGMDALAHSIESYVSLNANPLTEIYGLKAIELINQNLPTAVEQPENLEARGNMLLASFFGGCAITAGIGIAHIMAQPLGAMFHIPHGDACSIFLPASMEMNKGYAADKYQMIAQALRVRDINGDALENTQYAIDRVRDIRRQISAPERLRSYCGDEQIDMEKIIDTVHRTTGHITCNPRPLNDELIRDMFNACL